MIYFDNGATTYPKPACVRAAVMSYFSQYGANPGRGGHDMSLATARQIYETRTKAAKLFGAKEPEHVVFTMNCTHALNAAIKGILQFGDHVIISDLEHNAVLRPVHGMAAQGAITYTVVKADLHSEENTVAAFRNAIRPNTKLIAVTHGSNVFGIKMPIEKLAAMSRLYGVYFLVDAAQTAGCEPIHMQNMGIDFLAVAGHKGLYGPTGTGLLITPHGEKLNTLMEGGTGSMSMEPFQPDFMPDRLEAGTVNTMGIIGLGAGLGFVLGMGVENIARQEMKVASAVYQNLSKIEEVILYTPKPQYGKSLPVISFNVEGYTSEETTALLNEKGFALRGGLHCAPLAHKKMGTEKIGTARVSIGAFNNCEQAVELANAVKSFIANKKKIELI